MVVAELLQMREKTTWAGSAVCTAAGRRNAKDPNDAAPRSQGVEIEKRRKSAARKKKHRIEG